MTIERLNAFRRLRRASGKTPEGFEDVLEYIAGIQDDYMARIFVLRFLRAYSWAYCGFVMGNSEDNIRQMALRYLKADDFSA